LGFKGWGLRIQGFTRAFRISTFRYAVNSLNRRIQGSRIWADLGFWVLGFGLRVLGLGFRVQSLRFRLSSFGFGVLDIG
jgi:hypothetical protein